MTGLCALDQAQVAEDVRHWGSLSGAGFHLEFHPLYIDDPERLAELRMMPSCESAALRPPEICIIARSQNRADIAALLLYAADTVISGCVPFGLFSGWDPYEAQAISPELAEVSESVQGKWKGVCRRQHERMVDVAGLTVRLSRDRVLTDAAFSYLASVYLFSLDPMTLDPCWGTRTIPRLPNPMHRAWEAQSLFAAFQVIEILKLTVTGASSDRPSIIDGVWNPEIRSDLENRLSAIGIDSRARFAWFSRGTTTKAQRKMNARTSESLPAEWNGGHVRDEEIPYIDAINRAGWLRSSIAAHWSSSKLGGLHPLDTLNVQVLARMLLMYATKFPWWTDRKSKAENCLPHQQFTDAE